MSASIYLFKVNNRYQKLTKLVIARLMSMYISVCEAPSPAVMWIVNVREKKSQIEKKSKQ